MRTQPIGAIALSAICVSAAPVFANVQVEPIHSSSQKVLVTVLHDHLPMKDAKVEVLDAGGNFRKIALYTDDAGNARLPLLKPGSYHVVATADVGLHADLFLNVSKDHKKTTSFSMDLFVAPPPPPPFEERLAAAEKESTVARLAEFDGFVKDQVGAAIALTKVEVYRRGAFHEGSVASVSTNAYGAFSQHLPDGSYTAVFSSVGFSPEIKSFEIVQDSDRESLQIVLKVLPATQ